VPFELFIRANPAQNPVIKFVTPQHGGHCGFISNHRGAARFWVEQRIVEFCESIRAK
jgi:predicted alpha/beta-fold hydrolase